MITAGLAKSCEAAVQGMESTKTMNSLAGRSNYVGQSQMNGIPDPGAAVIAEAFTVALATLSAKWSWMCYLIVDLNFSRRKGRDVEEDDNDEEKYVQE